ncbi:MAG TPA: hypothetical protein VM285_15210 [Polyangia bacterium]|nr:hypothetical protein [Polyangia bacterium]
MKSKEDARRRPATYFTKRRFNGLFRHRGVESPRSVGVEPPDGWSKIAPDPMALLAGYPHLRLRSGLVLRAYQYRSGGNGNAVVWAMPADAPYPEPWECATDEWRFASPPRPAGVLDDFMEAVEADDTAEGYVSASIFARDCAELGAMWHGCGWSTHTILFSDPFTDKQARKWGFVVESPWPPEMARTGWCWIGPRPRRWEPRFTRAAAGPTVTFHTFSALGQESITRHVDVCPPGGRLVSPRRTVHLAEGPGGFLF